MHQNASKCMHNELCKGFVHKIIKELVFITFKGAKINEIHFPLYGGTPCIRQEQNCYIKKLNCSQKYGGENVLSMNVFFS